MTLEVTVERHMSSELSTMEFGGIGVTITIVLPGAVAVYIAELTSLFSKESDDCGDWGTPGTSDALLVPTPIQ